MFRTAALSLMAWLGILMSGCASMHHHSGLENAIVSRDKTPASNNLYGSEARPIDMALTKTSPSYFSDDRSDLAMRFQSDDSFEAQLLFNSEVFDSSDGRSGNSTGFKLRRRMGSLEAFWHDIKDDHRNFYESKNLPVAASLLGVGAWMANSDLDQNILEHIQDNITFNDKTNEYQEFVGEFRFFGEGYFLLPVYAGTALLGKHVFADNPNAKLAGEWGERSIRAVAIGAPILILSQLATGGSRPGESPDVREGSEWQFFEDNNGVSGHAFMGAIPFLTAYHMTNNRKLKVVYFAASTLPALSRITENGHYPSQALLGWGLAYIATSSIGRTENDSFKIAPYLSDSGIGIGMTMKR